MSILYLITGGLLAAHLATLRLLYHCRSGATEFTQRMTGESAEVTARMEEVCRIGSDIADLLEGVVDSGVLSATGGTADSVAEIDVKSAITSLLLSKVMGSIDGSEPQQEGSIYGEKQTKNQSTSTQDDNTPQE